MEEYRVNVGKGKLVDADVTAHGRTAAVVREGDAVSLLVDNHQMALPQDMRCPMVRFLDDEKVIIVDTRTAEGRENAVVLDLTTGSASVLYIGDAVEEIVSFGGCFAVGYFDEAYGNSEDLYGLVLFDAGGSPIWRDNSFMECYCACAQSERHLIYLCYPGFVLKQLDVATFETREWQTPSELEGARAVTSLGNVLFFHSPYGDEAGVYKWELGATLAQRIGDYPPRLRGLRGGRFISVDEAGQVRITPDHSL